MDIHFRILLYTISLAGFLAASPQSLPGGEPPPAPANTPDRFAALLDDETLCVVYVDFTRIDPAVVLDSGRKLLDRLFETAHLTLAERKSLTDLGKSMDVGVPINWDALKVVAAGGKAMLVDTLGMHEAFLVVHTGGKSFPALAWAAIPRHGKHDFTMLHARLKDNRRVVVRETNDFYVVAWSEVSEETIGDVRQADRVYNIAAEKPWRADPATLGPHDATARPDFLAARQAVKDYPIQVLLAPPKYMKKVFHEVRPTLIGPFEKFDITAIVEGLRWQAIGIQPNQLEFVAMTEAESANDANSLARNGREILSLAFKGLIALLKREKESPDSKNPLLEACSVSLCETCLERLGQYLLPQAEGTRITVRGSADMLLAAEDHGQKLSVTFLRKLIEVQRSREPSMPPPR